MLLLVLILVLIAFGLLVVALLSGSVLWAWVSVGVSVAAAAVLLIDWLQRRSALKAGAEAASAPSAEPSRGRFTPDLEPVTEVLPVIPRSDADSEAARREPDAPDQRFDETADSTQTIVMPIVQPSASAERPSGASGGTDPSSADSSLNVTRSGFSDSSSTPRGSADGSESPASESRPDTDASSPPVVAANVAPPTAATPSASAPATADAAAPTVAGTGTPGEDEASATAVADHTDADAAAGGEKKKAGTEPDRAPEAEDAAAETPAAQTPAAQTAASQTSAAQTSAAQTAAAQTPAAQISGAQTSASRTSAADTPAAERAGDPERPPLQTGAVSGSGNGVVGGTGTSSEAEVTLPAAEGEPPEEPSDPAAAAVVAGLETEVLVIDEQPRYHVDGCRSLAGKALIPLPVREAVELGFTPCGWCTPDRTLAGQQAAAR